MHSAGSAHVSAHDGMQPGRRQVPRAAGVSILIGPRLCLGRLGSALVYRRGADGVECCKREQTRKEAACMRLPRDRLAGIQSRKRNEAEQEVEAEPDRYKGQDSWVAQCD